MKNKTCQHFRQGDVLIERIASLPANLERIDRENGRVILAHGEVTGHAHAIAAPECDLFKVDDSGVTFLEVREAFAALRHDEHATIELPAGNYRVIRQREYTPEAIRNVAD